MTNPVTDQTIVRESEHLTNPVFDQTIVREFDSIITADSFLSIEDDTRRLRFDTGFLQLRQIICPLCNRQTFNLQLRGHKLCCLACLDKENSRRRNGALPACFSVENHTLPSSIGALPKLSEELLISKTHGFATLISSQNGGQAKMIVYLLNYVRDYTSLPPSASELPVVVIHSGSDFRQYDDLFMVDRNKILVWLNYLTQNHQSYRDVTIDQQCLNQLPETSGSIIDDLPQIDSHASLNFDNDILPPRVVVRNNIFSTDSSPDDNFADCREFFDSIPLPQNCSYVPVGEYRISRRFLSTSFPTLFPTEEGDFVSQRKFKLNFGDYLHFLITLSTRDFGTHLLFKHIGMALLQGRQFNDVAGYLSNNNLKTLQQDGGIVQDLDQAMSDEQRPILNTILEYSKNLRGTAAYFKAQGSQLGAHVAAHGYPHLFCTFSSNPDWQSLCDILPNGPYIIGSIQHRKALINHPNIVVQHFFERYRILFKNVIKPKFEVEDYWTRVEFTSSGRIHIHALYFCRGAPSFPGVHPDPNIDGPFAKIWGQHIRATTVDPNIQPDFSVKVTKYQTHHHSTQCRDPLNPQLCFWKFSRLINIEPMVDRESGLLKFSPQRNNDLLNDYCRVLLECWDGNIDIQPLTGLPNVLAYVSKRIPPSDLPLDIQHAQHTQDNNPTMRLVMGAFDQVSDQREWSSEEVSFALQRYPYVQHSRRVLRVDTRPIAFQKSREGTRGKRLLTKYTDRALSINQTYLKFLETFEQSHPSIMAKRILHFVPNPNEHDDSESYHRVKLMLHNVFVNEDDLKTHATWLQSWNEFVRQNPNTEFEDYLGSKTPHMVQDTESARKEYQALVDHLIPPNKIALGSRRCDRLHTWPIGDIHVPNDWYTVNMVNSQAIAIPPIPMTNVAHLNTEQRLLYDKVINWANGLIATPPVNEQFLCHLDGRGGTGKTYLIKMISSHLQQLLGRDVTCRASPTGKAAVLISGQTIHSAFRIPIGAENGIVKDIDKQTLLDRIRRDHQNTQLIILDEKSMISAPMLTTIDQRCRQIWSNHEHQMFGGRSLILAGDFRQLPPVSGSPMFTKRPDADQRYMDVYSSISESIFLETPIRTSSDQQFDSALLKIRNNEGDQETFDLFNSRAALSLTDQEISNFVDAPRIFFTNNMVNHYNVERLRSGSIPTKRIEAQDTRNFDSARLTCPNPKILFVQENMRCMITENISMRHGIVNGSLGTVRHLVWPIGSNAQTDIPQAILVEIDGYDVNFPAIVHQANPQIRCVPIFRTQFRVQAHCRLQFPIIPAYALTVHKSQGSTLDKVVLDLSKRDFAAGMTYTALSRVRSLNDLILSQPISQDKFTSNSHNSNVLEMMNGIKADEVLRRQRNHRLRM